MKRSYCKPVLRKRDQLSAVTAGGKKVSPFFNDGGDEKEGPPPV